MKLIGLARLGRDAELRRIPSGDAVCNLSLAWNYGQKGADGNRQTQWIDATLWGKRAEVLEPYLTKGGMHCFTLDDVHVETYQKNDGTEGIKMVARVIDVELGGKQDGGAAPRQSAPPAARTGAGYQQPAGGNPNPPAQQRPVYDDSDDIPF